MHQLHPMLAAEASWARFLRSASSASHLATLPSKESVALSTPGWWDITYAGSGTSPNAQREYQVTIRPRIPDGVFRGTRIRARRAASLSLLASVLGRCVVVMPIRHRRWRRCDRTEPDGPVVLGAAELSPGREQLEVGECL